jgi:hypothetical protein
MVVRVDGYKGSPTREAGHGEQERLGALREGPANTIAGDAPMDLQEAKDKGDQ